MQYIWSEFKHHTRPVCTACTLTQDKRFPPNASSIGEWKGRTPQQVNDEIKWYVRVNVCINLDTEQISACMVLLAGHSLHCPACGCVIYSCRKRVRDICGKGAENSETGAKLFDGKIEPNKICQGSLGDCWWVFMAACSIWQDAMRLAHADRRDVA